MPARTRPNSFIIVDSGWFLKQLACFLRQLAQLAQLSVGGLSSRGAGRGLEIAFNAAFAVQRGRDLTSGVAV